MKTAVDFAKEFNADLRLWVAEDPANRWAGMLAEDEEHWSSYGIHTADQLMEYLDSCVSKELMDDRIDSVA